MDIFTKAYIDAALWSCYDDDDEPLENNYDLSDIALDTLKGIMDDCKKFQKEQRHLLLQENYKHCDKYNFLGSAGHDFWLTRNRHGAGFWDGDWEKEVGEILTKKSQEFGEVNLYVGDDGQIYAD